MIILVLEKINSNDKKFIWVVTWLVKCLYPLKPEDVSEDLIMYQPSSRLFLTFTFDKDGLFQIINL